MLAKNMLDLRDYMRKNEIIISYSGYITEDILLGIGTAIKQKMVMENVEKKTIKKVFSIFVEQVQNVIRYSAERVASEDDDDNELRYGVLTVGLKEGNMSVTCGNVIERKDVERLRENLTKIQGMDKKELKALWKDTLRGETPDGSKGAGVGFIDIARRATEGFEFDFTDMDENNAFFSLKASI